MERLEALLGLLTLLMRVVLVADDLEGFSTDETAALRLAAFLGSLRQSVERLDVILSLNQDIWQSAFVPRLSGGLADRLSEVVVELEPAHRGRKWWRCSNPACPVWVRGCSPQVDRRRGGHPRPRPDPCGRGRLAEGVRDGFATGAPPCQSPPPGPSPAVEPPAIPRPVRNHRRSPLLPTVLAGTGFEPGGSIRRRSCRRQPPASDPQCLNRAHARSGFSTPVAVRQATRPQLRHCPAADPFPCPPDPLPICSGNPAGFPARQPPARPAARHDRCRIRRSQAPWTPPSRYRSAPAPASSRADRRHPQPAETTRRDSGHRSRG